MANDMRRRIAEWSGIGKPSATPTAEATPIPEAPEPVAIQHVALSTSIQEREKEWKERVHDRLLKIMDLTLIAQEDARRARNQVRDLANTIMNEQAIPLPALSRQRIASQIEDEIFGLGPLEPLLADPSVADILVNGWNSVYVERNGQLEPTDIRFRDNAHLRTIIDRIVSRVGRRIDESSPMVDARLADGSRVNAVIPPLAIDGPMLSIRRFTVRRLTLEQLVELGTTTKAIGELLSAAIRARLNILISGGTGSGKTTFLNVLSGFIPAKERIITIEDSAELQLQQPHVGRLETRPPNIEGRGEVTQRDLVRNALRMRPDRIIIGEVRSGEALDMLQAMNTGHEGSLTTVHANSPRDALSRIENMVAMAGVEIPSSSVRSQIASAIDIVLQVERLEDGKRRLVSIQEIQGMEGPVVTMSELFRFRRLGLDDKGNVLGRFEATGVVPHFQERFVQRGIDIKRSIYETA